MSLMRAIAKHIHQAHTLNCQSLKCLDDKEESTVIKRLGSDTDSTTNSSVVASSNVQSSIGVTYNKGDQDYSDTWDGPPLAEINSSSNCDHGNDEGNCQQLDNQSHATPSYTQAVPNLHQQDFSTPPLKASHFSNKISYCFPMTLSM
jgi:hypothetical protein